MHDLFISRNDAQRDILSAAAYVSERIRSADGHAEAMRSVVPLYLAKNNVDLAAELANAVDDPFERDRLLTLVAEKCADMDDDEYALQLADAVDDQALRSQALERIGLIKAYQGHPGAALGIAETMEHPDVVYSAVAVHYAGSGEQALADEIFGRIVYATAAVNGFEQLAVAGIKEGKMDAAALWLDRAVESGVQIEHDEERIRSLCSIGDLFLESKRNDRAIETFELARQHAEQLDNMHRDYFLVAAALGFLHAGSEDMSDRALDLVTDKTQMASALVATAQDQWKREQTDDARDTLDEAYAILMSQKENQIRDPRSRTGLLVTTAAQYAAFDRTDRGIETALDILEPDEQATAFSRIAQIQAARGEDGQARQTVNMIDDDVNRLIALVSLSDVNEKRGDIAAANSILNDAVDLAASMPQLGVRSEVLNAITDRFARRGDQSRARETAFDSLNVIAEIRDESSQAAALAGLSRIYEQASLDLGEAERSVLERLTVR